MKTNRIIVLSLLLFLCCFGHSQETYFWRDNQKQYMQTSNRYMYVLAYEPSDTNLITKQLRDKGIQCKPFEKVSVGIPNYETNSYWSVILLNDNRGLSIDNAQYTAPFFITQNDELVGLSHLFYVRLYKLEDTLKLKEMASENKVEILGNNQYRPLWFTLACSALSEGNALEMSNLFYESGFFSNSEPDIMIPDLTCSVKEETPCVNDSIFPLQWNLHNTGQNNGVAGVDIDYCNAKQITQGDSDIIIAVVDYGFDLSHPDLNNVHPLSYDVMTLSSPSQIYNPHGTACAGIIGATADNEIGIAGIAPECSLMSISCQLNLNTDISQKLANAIDFAWEHGVSVISNSWGHNSLPTGHINEAILNAVTYGRGGKGCVLVFASGNSNFSSVEYPSSNPNVISVGAIDRCGMRSGRSDSGSGSCEYWGGYTTAKGSSYGNGLCVVAPGTHIPTTDRSGYPGYSFGDYFEFFNGTSSACPHVSAIAGLILSVNPCLTYNEVKTVIESSCTKIRTDVYDYDTSSTHPNNTWNEQLGYGLINAYQAVLLAQQLGGYAQICNDDIHITDNITWGANKLIKKHLEIDSGAVLTITCTIHCTDSARLIVRPGGKLVVDGGTLTSACPGELWQGIEVVGDRTKRQLAQYQGTVELRNGATIENAHCGIHTGYHGDAAYATTGGIIKADSAFFINNRWAAAFLSYDNTMPNGSTIDNVSHFTNCEFIVDNNNLFAQNNCAFIDHVTMWKVKGGEVQGLPFLQQHNHIRRPPPCHLYRGCRV